MPLTGDYVRSHALPEYPDSRSYGELRAAFNGMLEIAAPWLEEHGAAEYLRLGTLALKEHAEECCIGIAFSTEISSLDSLPPVTRGKHVPCFQFVPRDPILPLTREYVSAHALPEVPDQDFYSQLREAINSLIAEAADWLDANGPVEYLHLGWAGLKAQGECCIWIGYVPEMARLDVLPESGDVGHIPCIAGGGGEGD